MLICIELSKMWWFIYLNVQYLLSIYLKILGVWGNIFYLSVIQSFASTFLLVIIKWTYEGYAKPENLGLCYRPIRMPNSITRQ